ncbi:NB-ARC domain-containing protein (plasmid) [Calothrix parasitica NIES-267]|uniref:NB-ARC domain-containing protein n=1 Tax=Calothrix parasitica NIES-267 TaxID=1973488 RepID=A0A1Z4M2J3_9CYAN|nr:NB-ARC domain-containing protein [Calothrix parasitica NIES-267]
MGKTTQPQKILILAANPIDTSKLRLDKEVAEIQAAHRQAKYREEIEIISEWAVGVDDLRSAVLYHKPNMIHFCGHGEGDDGLVLENENGQKQLVSSESLADLFKLFTNDVECVVLNACYTEVQAKAIHQHINCVVGMDEEIGDKAAIEFASGFYDALTNGKNYQDSFYFGCNAISLKSIPESQTPQIKIRDISKSLLNPDLIDRKSKNEDNENRNITIKKGNYFENVRGNVTIQKITEIYETINNLDKIPKPTGFPQNIPNSSTDKFVGRERNLELLHQQLQRNDEVVIAAVEGMGGVGKTELAIQYSLLHLQLQNYSGGICWLQAREQDIGLQVINFARTDLGLNPPDDLELPERVSWCWKRWHEGNTLIVLDDVTNYGDIKPYLPPQPSQFKVVITTRLKLDLAASLYLGVLQETDALELLTQLVGEEKVNKELEKAKELCQRLGNLPLALQLVGFYIKKRKISLTEILQRLEKKGLGHGSLVVKENDPTWTSDIKNGVAAAFKLSWEELSESAQELGCLLSLFALAPIPWSLVENTAVEQDSEESEDTIEELEDARIELESLHLVEGEHTYQFHQLIQEFFRNKQEKLAVAEQQKKTFVGEMLSIAQQIPNTPILSDIESVSDAIPHLKEVAENLITVVKDEDLYWAFVGIARFYQGQGLYALAEPWSHQCVSTLQARLGDEHPSVATSYNNLALLYFFQGRYTEAEPLYQKALELNIRVLGDEHPNIASSYNNLALLYFSQGRYTEAEVLYKKAISTMQPLLGEKYPDVATSYSNLATLYCRQGRYTEAEPLCKQALELNIRLLGEEHPDVATSYINLALLYFFQGRYTEAERLYKQALELNIRLLGEEHPNVATSYISLAELYCHQGRYTEAEPLCKQALELNIRLLGEEHPDVATSYNNLAGLYESQGRYTEAEPLYKKALELRQLLLGEEHPDVATSYNDLATLYFAQGWYTEAEPLYKKALELRQLLLGEEHPDVATSYNNLATLYFAQGWYTEAEPLYKKALEVRQRLLGEEHFYVAESYNNLAELYFSQRRYTEAETLYKQALELMQRLLGEEHPYVATIYSNLAGLYFSQGRYTEAEPLYEKALELRQRLLGEEHPSVATIYNNLATLYRHQRRYTEAETLYKKALELTQRLLGEEHPSVATSYSNLATLYCHQERYTEAETLYQKALAFCEQQLGIEHPNTITTRNNLEYLRNNMN